MNLETGFKEAKLLHDEPEEADEIIEPSKNPTPQLEKSLTVTKETTNPKPKTQEIYHSELSPLLEVIQNHQAARPSRLLSALESLAELGHDHEFGVIIAKSRNIENLLEIIENKSGRYSASSREFGARVIGASLRNNPKAARQSADIQIIERLLKSMETIFMSSIEPISTDVQNNKLIGSLIYAIGSVLSTNGQLQEDYSHQFRINHGGEILRRAFAVVGQDVKRKCCNFVFDLAFSLRWSDEELGLWSLFFQNALLMNPAELNANLRELILETLVRIHQYILDPSGKQDQQEPRKRTKQDPLMPVSEKFYKWVSQTSMGGTETKQALKEHVFETKE